jgi:hypothetical protein
MLEPQDDPPFPDGWHGVSWAPSPEDVELARKLTRERFGVASTEASTGRG